MTARTEIRLSNHAIKRLADRGVSRAELEDALRRSGSVVREETVYRIEKTIDNGTLVLYVKDKGPFNLIITYWIQ